MANLVLQVNTLTDLKNAPVFTDTVLFLVGKATLSDSLGGLYRWDESATGAEDTKFMNVIPSNVSGTGRWIRLFQTAMQLPQGYFMNTGGKKEFFIPATTDSNGQIAANLTLENTTNGTTLFDEVWSAQPLKNPNISTSTAPIIGDPSVSANRKALTCSFSKGASTTLGSTLLLIAGSVIPGLTQAPAGISVIIKVEGI